MMRIVGPIAANSNHPDSFSGRRERDDHRPPGRALVTVAAANVPPPRPAPGYRDALFVAQLIAGKAQLPQTRERRRAEPDEAMLVYRAATTAAGPVSGRNFSRES
jgi:hypothetical protein